MEFLRFPLLGRTGLVRHGISTRLGGVSFDDYASMNLSNETVEAMSRNYSSKPEDILTVIGPSICMDCYEVSSDVAEQFRAAYAQENWKNIMYDKGNGKFQLNLWEVCRINFLRAGILEEHIVMPEICT